MTPQQVQHLIRTRRSVYPRSYEPREIPDSVVWEILENGQWAPTHKMTQPWRFKVFKGKGLQKLSDFLAFAYENYSAPGRYVEKKRHKIISKPLQSGCVVAICMQRDPKESLPEWEEISAVATAVQNMWLTCTAHGIGAFWSSPSFFVKHAGEFLQLQEGEKSLGLFYMGYSQAKVSAPPRVPIKEQTVWFIGE